MGDVDVGMIGAPMHRINRRIQGVYAEQSFNTKKGGKVESHHLHHRLEECIPVSKLLR